MVYPSTRQFLWSLISQNAKYNGAKLFIELSPDQKQLFMYYILIFFLLSHVKNVLVHPNTFEPVQNSFGPIKSVFMMRLQIGFGNIVMHQGAKRIALAQIIGQV